MPYQALDPSTAQAAPVTTAGAPLTSVGETLGFIRAELLLELGSRVDVDVPRLNKWINWGYRNLAGMLKITELKASLTIVPTALQPFYLLPIQVRSVQGVSIINSTNYPEGGLDLVPSNEDEYNRQPNETYIGTTFGPTRYFRYGRMLVVYPYPVASVTALNVKFNIRPDDMTLDTHSPLLPPEFHEPLTLHAKHKALRSLKNYTEAATAANDFLQVLRPLIDTDGEEADDQPRGLTVVKCMEDLYRVRR